ncbi:hypothetical protein IO411_001152 [Campylobacter lari]|nr:hypothetical protein [Campylobacter lari]
MQKKLQFITSILDAKKETNNNYKAFEELIENDYKNFASKARLKEELNSFMDLQSIKNELLRVVSLKAIANKSTIAVGGGFSAGKSQFISSFFANKNIKLPIDVQPVTAIASYIFNANEDKIIGYSYNGGIVNIPLEIYSTLSHDFIKELGFNLKTILPMMAMQTSIPDFPHICFVDTPGYNPPKVGSAKNDFETAKEYLNNANALIWMIGLDSNGTIPHTDLDFLEKLNLENKKLYIVANKADCLPIDELERVLDNFEDNLLEFGFEYEGISAYDSINKEEIVYRKQTLRDFINCVDKNIISKEQIAQELNEVFLKLKKELLYEKKKQEDLKSTIHSLDIEILEANLDDSSAIDRRLDKLKSIVNIAEIQDLLDELEQLRKKAFEILNEIFFDIFNEKLQHLPDFDVEISYIKAIVDLKKKEATEIMQEFYKKCVLLSFLLHTKKEREVKEFKNFFFEFLQANTLDETCFESMEEYEIEYGEEVDLALLYLNNAKKDFNEIEQEYLKTLSLFLMVATINKINPYFFMKKKHNFVINNVKQNIKKALGSCDDDNTAITLNILEEFSKDKNPINEKNFLNNVFNAYKDLSEKKLKYITKSSKSYINKTIDETNDELEELKKLL